MGKSNYAYFSYPLNAGQSVRINYVANYLLLRSNTGAVNTLQVSINGQEYQTIPVGTKFKFPADEEWLYIDVKNNDSGATTFALQLGLGDIDNADITFSGSITTNISATSVFSGTAVTATTTAGATSYTPDSTCRTLDIYNNGSFPVWYGDSTVNGSTGKGIPILAGEKVSIDTSAQQYFHAVGGSSQLTFNEHRKA